MDWGGPEFFLGIIAICTGGWIINNWIRARHGYALEDEWGGKTHRPETEEAQKLKIENAELRSLLARVEERTQVLERIVTDKGYSLTEEIEALRDTREVEDQGSGVPLDMAQERAR